MRRALKLKLATFVFWFAKRFCQAELNQIIGEVAMNVASKASVQMTRASFINAGVAVCRYEFCTQRFGLRRTPQGMACMIHAPKHEPEKEPVAA